MKEQSKLRGNLRVPALAGLIILSSITISRAQTYNVTTVANFALTGVRQNGEAVSSVRMGTKDIIAALNATGQFNFGSGAQIVMISFEDQLPRLAVRERSGTNLITTDIGGFFYLTESDEIHSANNLMSYVIQDYQFDNHNGTSFSVSGLSTLKRGNISGLQRVRQISAQVNGPGSVNGDEALFRGAMSAGSPKAEVAE